MSDKFLLRAIGKNEPSRTGDKFRNAERNFRDFESFIDHLPNDDDDKSFVIEFFRDSKHIIFNDVLDKLESILYKVKKKNI